MHVYRIHIRPSGGEADMVTTFQYCLDNGLLGVGWRLYPPSKLRRTKNWDEYYRKACRIYDDLRICEYIYRWIQKGDLVWTRDPDGQYYLARVKSGWEYWTTRKGIDDDIDIANIFRCDFQRANLDEVPGKIVSCFRPSRTIQGISDGRAVGYSQHLWNTLSNSQDYDVEQSEYSDIFIMLDDEETEDLLFLYLQSKKWYVIPNSRKGDTMKFEFLVTNSRTGEKAITQVKTGDTAINIDDFTHLPYKVFLFQSNEYYEGTASDNVVCVSRRELQKFLQKRIDLFPSSFLRKLEMVRS